MSNEIMYVEANLKDILAYYMKGYCLTGSTKVLSYESFTDVNKDTVVFKLILENQNN